MTGWRSLPPAVRQAVEAECCGTVNKVVPAPAGSVSEFAGTLHSASGLVFCKAITVDNPLAWMCRNEARIAPALTGVAPALEWMVETGGWLVLGFEHVPGHHADLSPGSADLPRLAGLLADWEQRLTPALVPVLSLAERWGKLPAWAMLAADPPADIDPWVRQHLPTLADLEAQTPSLVGGETLVHTDFTGANLLVDRDRMWVVDWSWPARAAAWVNAAFAVFRLTDAGHSPADAEAWAGQLPAWSAAPRRAVTAFAASLYGIRYYRAVNGGRAPHNQRLADAAHRWVRHRLTG